MTTFSQMVDLLLKEIVRPDMVTMLPDYLNQTIREMHTNAQTSLPVAYADNRIEHLITIDSSVEAANNFVWPLPDPTRFQMVEAIYYRSVGRYAKPRTPDVARVRNFSDPLRDLYYYRSGPNLAFSKPGGVGDIIEASILYYPRRLQYQQGTQRKVRWNAESEVFEYINGGTIADLGKATNWLLQRHADCLMEGTRAKAYKRMDDQNRAKLAYSQYESMRAAVIATESVSPDVQYNN